MAASGGAVRTAADFFGAADGEDATDKFKTVAFRALHDQKIEEELAQTKQESDRLKRETAALEKKVANLQASLEVNIEDRERVLAFKSKRIEELHGRVKDLEAINASLLETINGGKIPIPPPGVGEEVTGEQARAARMSLLNAGKPLFHALDTCKEQEYKRLYDEKRVQSETLLSQISRDYTLVEEARVFQKQKHEFEARLATLESMLATEIAEKEEVTLRMERKLLFENERLRKEKEVELLACQQSMEKQMRKQLDVTTQRTVEENERVQIELRFQSTQLERLVKRMDQVAADNRKLQQEKELFEDMNASLSKKLKFYEQLFSTMQRREEQQQQQQQQNSYESAHEPQSPRACKSLHHKPPLPLLTLPLSSPRNKVDSSSPTSYFGDDSPYSKLRLEQDELREPQALDHATDMLEKHLLGRDFTRKQLAAAVQYHHEVVQQQKQKLSGSSPVSGISPTFARKRIMLPKATYLPSTYQSGRKIRQAPMTLDTLIRQKAVMLPMAPRPPPNTQQDEPAESAPSKVSSSPFTSLRVSVAPMEMWKASSLTTSDGQAASPPATARF